MQSFKDSIGGKVWSFEDDVVVVNAVGVYSFITENGDKLRVPKTLQPYTAPVLTATEIAANAAASSVAAYKNDALKALRATDATMHRINEGVALGETSMTAADVVAYVHYRRALRQIISAADPDVTAPLPAAPAYPVGT